MSLNQESEGGPMTDALERVLSALHEGVSRAEALAAADACEVLAKCLREMGPYPDVPQAVRDAGIIDEKAAETAREEGYSAGYDDGRDEVKTRIQGAVDAALSEI